MRRVIENDPSAREHVKLTPEPTEPPFAFIGLYSRALEALANDRPALPSGGYGPIPFSSIDCYAKRHNIEGEDFEVFRLVLTQVDEACLKAGKDGGNRGG